jgi:FAD/FMN-containing dehydrogenase
MTALKVLEGDYATLDDDTVSAFAASLRGDLLTADSDAYDDVRVIWNAMIDRRPGAIVRCAGARDVVTAVDFARAHDLLVTVRGAGHNIAGNAVADGALLIDLSGMTSIHVDPVRATVRAEPGCTLGDLDHETQAFGLAVPTGINSTTGIAGLTLGGGFGWISRKYGMTIDSLISADVVTADGRLVRASETENADLFWGIRGGGGNFGIVTSFEFRAHPVGPEVLSGLIVHPFSDAMDVLQAWRDYTETAPDEVTVWMVGRKAPPLPFLPEEVHGTPVIILAAMYTGDMAAGEAALAPLRAVGNPIADVISPHPFAGWQAAFDPLLTPGARNYWKSHNFSGITDDILQITIDAVANLPGPQCEVFIAQLGGATSRVASDATAYPARDAQYLMNVHGRWDEPSEDEAGIGWSRQLFRDLEPHATGNVYVNFMPADEVDRITGAYGSNYDRLVELKRKWDPSNMFRMNQNIRP